MDERSPSTRARARTHTRSRARVPILVDKIDTARRTISAGLACPEAVVTLACITEGGGFYKVVRSPWSSLRICRTSIECKHNSCRYGNEYAHLESA